MRTIQINGHPGPAFPRRGLGVVLWLCAVCLLAGCSGPIAIGKIIQDPRKYDGKTVTVEGMVSDRQSLVVIKYYSLTDKTGKITVVTERALPQDGLTARVKGTVHEALSIGDKSLLVLKENPKD